MARTPEEALMIEHDLAGKHAQFYIVNLLSQISRRSLILNGAIQEFNSFMNLPPSSNAAAAIFEFAFGVLTALVPALKLGPFIAQANGRAATALQLAERWGEKQRLADKAKKAVTGAIIDGTAGGQKLKDYYDKIKPNVENAIKMYVPEMATVEEHASRKPIFDLIKELDAAKKLWEEAVKAELAEWINRVDDVPPPPGPVQPLDKMMETLLPPLPSTYSDSELKEIWTVYLWEMVGQYCVQKVKWKVKRQGRALGGDQYTIEGLNDAQRGQIYDWFGPRVARGKYFNKPMLYPPYVVGAFLDNFPVKVEEVKTPIMPRVA